MDNTTKGLVFKASSGATFMLLIAALFSFLFLVVFEAEFYAEKFELRFHYVFATGIGFIMAIVVAVFRFAFLLSSAQDIINKNWGGAIVGAVVSIALVAYELFSVCDEMGMHWSTETIFYENKFWFLVLIGLVAEFRLCMLLLGNGGGNGGDKSKHHQVGNLHDLYSLLKKQPGGPLNKTL